MAELTRLRAENARLLKEQEILNLKNLAIAQKKDLERKNKELRVFLKNNSPKPLRVKILSGAVKLSVKGARLAARGAKQAAQDLKDTADEVKEKESQ